MVQDSDNGRPIWSRVCSIERRHFQWPWTTPNLVLKVTPFFDIEYLTNGYKYDAPLGGPRRNIAMPFGRSHTSHDLLLDELLDVEYYRNLETWVRGHSIKVIETGAVRKLGCGFLFACHSNYAMAVSVAVCEIFSVKEWRNLQNQVRGRSRSLKAAPFDRHMRLSIGRPL